MGYSQVPTSGLEYIIDSSKIVYANNIEGFVCSEK